MKTNKTPAPVAELSRADEIQAELRTYGLAMSHSLSVFDGTGHAIEDIATGDLADGELLDDYIISLASEWSILEGADPDEPLLIHLTPPTVSEPGPAAASAALQAHRLALGIEGDAQVQLDQMLVSVLEFCAAREIDFDAGLAHAREILRDSEP